MTTTGGVGKVHRMKKVIWHGPWGKGLKEGFVSQRSAQHEDNHTR